MVVLRQLTSLNRGEGLVAKLAARVGGGEGEGKGSGGGRNENE